MIQFKAHVEIFSAMVLSIAFGCKHDSQKNSDGSIASTNENSCRIPVLESFDLKKESILLERSRKIYNLCFGQDIEYLDTPVDENSSNKQRMSYLGSIQLDSLILPPGKTFLMSDKNPPRSNVVINITADKQGINRFGIDVWEGTETILQAIQSGSRTIQELQSNGISLEILINGWTKDKEEQRSNAIKAASYDYTRKGSYRVDGQSTAPPQLIVDGQLSHYELGSRSTLKIFIHSKNPSIKPFTAGIHWGTFDPPHRGHIMTAKQGFIHTLKTGIPRTDEQVIIPFETPHKPEASSITHRTNMVALTWEDDPKVLAFIGNRDFDFPFSGKSLENFMFDLVRSAYGTPSLVVVIGQDVWEKKYSKDLDYVRGNFKPYFLIAYRYTGQDSVPIPSFLQNKLGFVEARLNLSSTAIKEGLKKGEPNPLGALNASTTKYIKAHGLYQ